MSAELFNLNNDLAYQSWRRAKLEGYPLNTEKLFCNISDEALSVNDIACLQNLIGLYNMAFYRMPEGRLPEKAFVLALGQGLGLQRLDGNLCSDEDNITALQVKDMGRANTYIPYTDRPLSWHTDGYYNTPDKQIRAISMHCVRAAATGGENLLMDHELAYIQLRDENPAYIQALMHPQAMTIPPNIENGREIRPAQSGPVFSLMADNGRLHMRYSARSRNIEWRDDELTREAVACLNTLLCENNPYVIAYRLQPGEGIICNNVLHNRSRFIDADKGAGRLLYRARYYDRVANT